MTLLLIGFFSLAWSIFFPLFASLKGFLVNLSALLPSLTPLLPPSISCLLSGLSLLAFQIDARHLSSRPTLGPQKAISFCLYDCKHLFQMDNLGDFLGFGFCGTLPWTEQNIFKNCLRCVFSSSTHKRPPPEGKTEVDRVLLVWLKTSFGPQLSSYSQGQILPVDAYMPLLMRPAEVVQKRRKRGKKKKRQRHSLVVLWAFSFIVQPVP